MKTAIRKGKNKNRLGLNKQGRIDWSNPINNLSVILSKHGMHAHVISKKTGLSVGAVHYRNKKTGICLRDYRNGFGEAADLILKTYTLKSVENGKAK